MERHFDEELRKLKTELLAMAGHVERSIEHAANALVGRAAEAISNIYELEQEVNREHKSVDEACLRLLALQQPLAADLRLIVAVIKINTDLERMGDQAVNIAHHTERYMADRDQPEVLVDLPEMFSETRFMVREAIDAFVKNDETLARDVLKRDDRVDAFKHKIYSDILNILQSEPKDIEQGFSLILIARNLERIADHATNIAEDVIFAITGSDVRHSPRTGPS
ncbi:MAG: phosphate transport system regulatory protein PhoU [Bdellovibrionales bacterium RIFOXYC1_FULL_54_43]|nr:MAG: phosphate transport system regulatory protein PhoU [Bdellovibrionales bacterium RIFOXYC1_FULL_54_43]OFZ80643.1 MAG: phosphate transport system regulatory protein PhoU [Bdellovibrionales bacterium RIFOXYD1_FULL_55_31]